jgi:diguanylate cyclase (GGDEF)-like protein
MTPSTGSEKTPGGRLYLFRLLQQLATAGSAGSHPLAVSYDGAREMATRIGLDRPEKLVRFFDDLGLGILTLEIEDGWLRATLSGGKKDDHAGSPGPGGCELERGILDGSLTLITGVDVTTLETMCRFRDSDHCCFEASREAADEAQGFRPRAVALAHGDGIRPAVSTHAVSSHKAFAPAQGYTDLRAWYLDSVSREMARSQRHGRPLSLLYIDLDDIGEINATMGREAGDQVINAAAISLSRCCRAEDFLWHHGEDEFILALAETKIGCAEIVARRLNTEIISAAEYLDIAAGVSASIGFASYPTHADSLVELLKSARSALYLAKSLGKARVQAAWDEDEVRITTPYRECDKPEDEIFEWPAYHPSRRHKRRTSDKSKAQVDVHDSETGGGMQGRKEGEPLQDSAGEPATGSTGKGRGGPGGGEPGGHAVTEAMFMKRDMAKNATSDIPSEAAISALIASSSPLLLAGMRQVVSASHDIDIAGEATDPDTFFKTISDLRPDLILSDMNMAAARRFSVLRQMQEENLPCKYVVFANDVDQKVLRVAADFNVDGVIMQDTGPDEVFASLQNIYEGKRSLPENVQTAINELENNRRLLQELSEREIEVLRLVAEGKSNSQIAKDLFITVNTVRFHLANIYQKLNVSNRTEAANYYLRQGLNEDGQTKLL